MRKPKVKAKTGFKPRAFGYKFVGDDTISITSVDANSTLTVDVAKKEVKKVIRILKRGDVDFVEFTGTILLNLKKEFKAEWIEALEDPIDLGL